MRNGRKVGSAIIAIGVAASMLTMTACGTAGENDNASKDSTHFYRLGSGN